jgi:mono/diheme cytochrome c family protein
MQVAAQAPTPATPAGPIQRADVAKIFNTECAVCHGIDGAGKQIRAGMPTIPDFTSLAWQMAQTDLEVTHRIREGNEPLMPAYRDKLAPPQLLALTVYVRAFAVLPAEPAAFAKPAPPLTAAAQMSPTQIFRAYCLACHDADGRGQTVRKAMPELSDFTDPKWQDSRSDAELKQSILEGKGKFMLPMKDKLNPNDADKMVGYVRAFRGGKQVVEAEPHTLTVPPHPDQPTLVIPMKELPKLAKPPAPSLSPEVAERTRVATGLYRQYCLTCHGADGKGLELRAAMPTIPDFANRSWQATATNPQLAISILDGKGTLMPAFRGRVEEEQARDLVAYVRAFGPAPVSPPAAVEGDFENRFRELQQQWNELQKQLEDLSKRPREK